MPIINLTAEDIRNPNDSSFLLVHNEAAAHCDGGVCGTYHEENGVALTPLPHSHLVITGQDPATTPRYYRIPRSPRVEG